VANKLAITLRRSMIGRPERERVTLRTLGFKKREQTVVQPDNASIRGMVQQVVHLVDVTEVTE
jgi:large subunit ribosomal protein L30